MDKKCFEVNNIAGSSNGRIADSESVHLGSNPSPAVTNSIKNPVNLRGIL